MSARHQPLTQAALAARPYAFNQRLAVTTTAGGLTALSGGKASPVAGSATVDVFDVLITPASAAPLHATVSRVMFERSRAAGKPPREVRGTELPVELPASADLTYIDLVRLAHQQNRDVLRPGRHSSPFDIAAHREQLAGLLARGADAAEIEQQRWQLLQAWLF